MRTIVRTAVTLVLALCATCVAVLATDLNETGSTLLYPLMNLWIESYGANHRDVSFATNATGSGVGVAEAISGSAQIGASDAYLSDEQLARKSMMNIPLAVSAQLIDYNVPELGSTQLRLNGPVLAGIYEGSIVSWDDPKIADLNRDRARLLPHREIVALHRAESSGDTYLFSRYLSATTLDWAKSRGYGTRVDWSSSGKTLDARGNAGMVDLCHDTPYSIAYVGISYLERAAYEKLTYALLQNRAGAFVAPTAESIAAAAATTQQPPPKDARISLVYAPGAKAYPIVNYEYAIVNQTQPNVAVASELVRFLDWIVAPNGGNAPQFLDHVHFAPLPAAVARLSREQIAAIHVAK